MITASRKVSKKKKVRDISRFAERDLLINQGELLSMIAEARPTAGWEMSVPRRKIRPRHRRPRIAAAIREPNSLSPNKV